MKPISPRLRSGLSLLAVVLVVAAASEGWRTWSTDRVGTEVASLARPGDIEMIASDTCIFCLRARAWFNEHGVPFTECSIERDADCAARFAALGSPGTPVLLVRGQRQLGFSPPAVAGALRGG